MTFKLSLQWFIVFLCNWVSITIWRAKNIKGVIFNQIWTVVHDTRDLNKAIRIKLCTPFYIFTVNSEPEVIPIKVSSFNKVVLQDNSLNSILSSFFRC